MSEFESFDPDVEVRGEVLLAWIEGTQHKIVPFLEEQDIYEVQAGDWYNLQAALDGLREFGMVSSLFNAGLLIPEHAIFPPGLDTLHAVVNALDTAYHMNHRNGEIGHYTVDVINNRQISITVNNPYPCEFDYGLLTYLANQFPVDSAGEVRVMHDPDAPCRKNGQHSCTYHMMW